MNIYLASILLISYDLQSIRINISLKQTHFHWLKCLKKSFSFKKQKLKKADLDIMC